MRNILFLSLIACAAEEASNTTNTEDAASDISEIPTPSADTNTETEDTNNDSSNSDTSQDDEPAETKEYQFGDADSLLYVQVWKDDSASLSGFAHNHVMRAAGWSGYIAFNTDDIDECEFDFSVPVTQLKVDEDAMREHVGYEDIISTSDRSQIREHMLADNQLNASNHSEITFLSVGCTQNGTDGLIVEGDMFLAGTTKRISLDLDFSVQSNKAYVSGIYEFTHSDYNIEPYTAFFGQVRNGEDLKITFDMAGQAL